MSGSVVKSWWPDSNRRWVSPLDYKSSPIPLWDTSIMLYFLKLKACEKVYHRTFLPSWFQPQVRFCRCYYQVTLVTCRALSYGLKGSGNLLVKCIAEPTTFLRITGALHYQLCYVGISI